MRKDPDIKLIDIAAASQMLGISADTLRRYDANGKLRAIRLATNGKRMYKIEDLERFMKGKK